ncbi:MAG TPA: nucleotide exchange factor GrpE [Candidatus Nanoarchaeia archaeon]
MRKTAHKVNNKRSVELENQLKRALADYANLQKRVEEEKKTVVKFANILLIAKFLDVLDSLEEAQKNINSEGLELVIKKFKDILEAENVKEISVEGGFNPQLHEGIATVEGDREGAIAEVLQKGYLIGDKVLRPARVKVTAVNKESRSVNG